MPRRSSKSNQEVSTDDFELVGHRDAAQQLYDVVSDAGRLSCVRDQEKLVCGGVPSARVSNDGSQTEGFLRFCRQGMFLMGTPRGVEDL